MVKMTLQKNKHDYTKFESEIFVGIRLKIFFHDLSTKLYTAC